MKTEEKKSIQSGNVHHGHTIKRLRRARGITQKQLAQLIHVSQQQISLYEEKDEIEERMLKQFSEVLEVPVDLIKNLEEDSKLSFYIENNTQENENSPGSKNVTVNESNNSTNNYTDKALYTALEQMQKLYEKGMELYANSLQSNNNLLKTLQERIDLLEKQQNK